MQTTIFHNAVTLLPEKALLLTDENILVIADLHIGKVEHFRNNGIQLPEKAGHHTISKLTDMIQKYGPTRIIFLGDLFHSTKNQSYEHFRAFLERNNDITFDLIIGNHDIMSPSHYVHLGLNTYEELIINGLWLTHEPQDELRPDLYNIAGHIHPGIRLTGKGKQSLVLPCFYFGIQNGIIPAFGYFTGKAMIKVDKNSNIFAIADNTIIKINQ